MVKYISSVENVHKLVQWLEAELKNETYQLSDIVRRIDEEYRRTGDPVFFLEHTETKSGAPAAIAFVVKHRTSPTYLGDTIHKLTYIF